MNSPRVCAAPGLPLVQFVDAVLDQGVVGLGGVEAVLVFGGLGCSTRAARAISSSSKASAEVSRWCSRSVMLARPAHAAQQGPNALATGRARRAIRR